MKKNNIKSLELLSPAKDLVGARCAVDYGADALYMGASGFGARKQASNSLDDIARAVEYAHGYGVKLYVALNTLLFEDELPSAERLAQELCACGVDALIVQDMAYTRMNLPSNMALHASTQMCNMDAQWINFLEKSGFSRVVLERALSLSEIASLREQCSVEFEAFVHGAICVGHSGRCYLSRTFSERSGNRGDCMQACRLKYDLVNSRGEVLARGKHLLSLKDMNQLANLKGMIDAGVSSFKIEGRLKGLDYIKNSVSSFRLALDKELAEREDCVRSSYGSEVFDFESDLTKTFTREGGDYFMHGKRSGVANFDSPKALGAYMGKVKSVLRDSFVIDNQRFTSGDGICFLDANSELCGTNINKVVGNIITPNRMDNIAKGCEIYRNFDKKFSDALERSKTSRRIDLSAEFECAEDKITLTLEDNKGVSITQQLDGEFSPARDTEKMLESVKSQISKSQDSAYYIKDIRIKGEVFFVPISQLNSLRRKALGVFSAKVLEDYSSENRAKEDMQYKFKGECVNVVNSLAQKFYADHGAECKIEGLDLRQNEDEFLGERVMFSSYCIRREIGECLKTKGAKKEELFLVYKDKRYALEFDCKNCRMNLIYVK
ncbi:MAG: U32 family peptidase [Rikenellaceae bacterium]